MVEFSIQHTALARGTGDPQRHPCTARTNQKKPFPSTFVDLFIYLLKKNFFQIPSSTNSTEE